MVAATDVNKFSWSYFNYYYSFRGSHRVGWPLTDYICEARLCFSFPNNAGSLGGQTALTVLVLIYVEVNWQLLLFYYSFLFVYCFIFTILILFQVLQKIKSLWQTIFSQQFISNAIWLRIFLHRIRFLPESFELQICSNIWQKKMPGVSGTAD